ncbi:MAG TPA: TIGR03619 family F420-dependent LLM class oxidoreductase [Candidatus Saccharimonadales bacterium]
MIPKPVAIVPEKILPAQPDRIVEYATTVEAMGYWAVTAKDHVVLGRKPDGNNGYTNEQSFFEPMTLFSYMAGVTRRIKMITGVMVLPQRPTALMAKQAQAVSDMSGGRLILGVGVGSNATEFAAMGASMSDRGKRMDEQLVALRNLWHQPYADLSVGNEQGRGVGINPLPKHEIPIWLGGWARQALIRTAKFADGWAPMGHPADAEKLLPFLYEQLDKNGRDPDAFDLFGAFSTLRHGTQAPDTIEQREKDLDHWMNLGATAVGYGRQANFAGLEDRTLSQREALDAHLEDLATHIEMFSRITGYKLGASSA